MLGREKNTSTIECISIQGSGRKEKNGRQRARREGISEEGECAWEGQKMRCSERIEKESSRKETVMLGVCGETQQT